MPERDPSLARQLDQEPERQSTRRPQAEADNSPRNRGEDRGASDADLTPREKEEKEKAREEVRAALTQLYRQLSNRRDNRHHLSTGDIVSEIDRTPLSAVRTPFKRQLVSAIEHEDLDRKDEHEFVHRGLEVLDLWIHLQGLKRGTDRDLAMARRC